VDNSDRRPAVLILGGGPAGLMTAFRIVTGGATAVVVERGRHDAVRIGEHLPPEGVALARSAGVAGLDDDAHVKCPGVSAWWGADSPHHMDYLFHPAGHGLNLSRPHFDSSLAEQCRRAGVRILTGARLVAIARTPRGWLAHVRSGDDTMRYEPRIVVDATGSAAAFARSQGASIEACPGQVALVACRTAGSTGEPARLRLSTENDITGLPWSTRPLLEITRGATDGSDEVSVTGGYGAIAETGTLMLTSGAERPTTLNFLPETHIVVLPADRVVGALEQAWAKLRGEFGAGNMPRTVNFITGPSRSADIEQTLQMGAHGPRRLHIILIDGEAAAGS